ncbi:hypothetical protein PoB_000122300 [Plakobranchus ocellatus]|uniref:Uncharacterized protein n=1 Tax=Plakobranchus ocellatus TaxID=259542 RepID=A0AAV3XWH8_9GAST|nr:hypothetical protein PoB_000122300 [Plakobranchus ocellatus]
MINVSGRGWKKEEKQFYDESATAEIFNRCAPGGAGGTALSVLALGSVRNHRHRKCFRLHTTDKANKLLVVALIGRPQGDLRFPGPYQARASVEGSNPG